MPNKVIRMSAQMMMDIMRRMACIIRIQINSTSEIGTTNMNSGLPIAPKIRSQDPILKRIILGTRIQRSTTTPKTKKTSSKTNLVTNIERNG